MRARRLRISDVWIAFACRVGEYVDTTLAASSAVRLARCASISVKSVTREVESLLI